MNKYLIGGIIVLAFVGVGAYLIFSVPETANDATESSEAEGTEIRDEIDVDQQNGVVTAVIAACKQRQEDKTAPSGDEFDCDKIVLESQTNDFGLFSESGIWMLAREVDDIWHIVIWSSMNDNPDICDTGTDNGSLLDYCATR
jgi:hypothetical protein